jgi:hypothetical protein
MRSGYLVIPALAALAGCGGANSSSPLTMGERYARLQADLGSETAAADLARLEGTFHYQGYGAANLSPLDGFVDATYEASLTAELSETETDYLSGQLENFTPLGADGFVTDNQKYEGVLVLNREAISGNSASGGWNGTLRLTTTDDTGAVTETTTYAIGGDYGATFYNSSRGDIPAEYIDGFFQGLVPGGDPLNPEDYYGGGFTARR